MSWVGSAVDHTELQVLEHNSLLSSSSNLLSGESVVFSIIVHLRSWVIVELVPRVPVLVGWSPQEPLTGLVSWLPLGLGLLLNLLWLSILLLLGILLLLLGILWLSSVDVGVLFSSKGLSHVVHGVPSSHSTTHFVGLGNGTENFLAVLFVALWVHHFPHHINHWLVSLVNLVSTGTHFGNITCGVSKILFPSKIL